MGARLLADWLTSPLTDLGLIVERHEAVAELVRDSALRADLRRSHRRLARPRTTWPPGAYRSAPVGATLATSPRVSSGASEKRWRSCPGSRPAWSTARASKRLGELEAALELCPEIRSSIESALVDDPPLAVKEGGLIREGYHAPTSTS